MQKISKTPEMVVAFAIAWCAMMSGLSSYIGLSREMGALIAGAAISSFPFGVHIIAKVLPLRDFFLTLFFLSIGMRIPVPDFTLLWTALIIVVFVILSRFITIYPILSWAGRGPRTCFVVSLMQISEFSWLLLLWQDLDISVGYFITDYLRYGADRGTVFIFYKSNHHLFLLFDNYYTLRSPLIVHEQQEEKRKTIFRSFLEPSCRPEFIQGC
jgi:hypothetical protein